MKILKYMILGLILLSPTTANALERSTVNGAAPLSKGSFAVSFDLGIDFPEPVGYGVRFDFGVLDRIQFGVGFFTLGNLANTAGIYTLFNPLRTKNERHFLSLYVVPAFLHLSEKLLLDENPGNDNLFAFILQEGLAYEARFGSRKQTGLYFKTGSSHFLGANTSSGKTLAGGFGTKTSSLDFGPGIQTTFGNRWSFGLEGKTHYLLFNVPRNTSRYQFTGKLGFTKAF